MQILDPKSLIVTVDRFNAAEMAGTLAEIDDMDPLVEWTSARLGTPDAYAGSFGMTPADWKRPFHLFTGEPLKTDASRAHIIAEETLRMLLLIEETTGRTIEARETGEARLAEQIFGKTKNTVLDSGIYCCATCSVAMWRAITAGAYEDYAWIREPGMNHLRDSREANGGWKRFPFYYTLLCLGELMGPAITIEIGFHREAGIRRLRSLKSKRDTYSKRRRDLLQRVFSISD